MLNVIKWTERVRFTAPVAVTEVHRWPTARNTLIQGFFYNAGAVNNMVVRLQYSLDAGATWTTIPGTNVIAVPGGLANFAGTVDLLALVRIEASGNTMGYLEMQSVGYLMRNAHGFLPNISGQ